VKVYDAHTMCSDCWDERHPDRQTTQEFRNNARLPVEDAETCCYCGKLTRIVIPVRDTAPEFCPAREEGHA
jgi:hypothetical protein